jgi:hypothetical protein
LLGFKLENHVTAFGEEQGKLMTHRRTMAHVVMTIDAISDRMKADDGAFNDYFNGLIDLAQTWMISCLFISLLL